MIVNPYTMPAHCIHMGYWHPVTMAWVAYISPIKNWNYNRQQETRGMGQTGRLRGPPASLSATSVAKWSNDHLATEVTCRAADSQAVLGRQKPFCEKERMEGQLRQRTPFLAKHWGGRQQLVGCQKGGRRRTYITLECDPVKGSSRKALGYGCQMKDVRYVSKTKNKTGSLLYSLVPNRQRWVRVDIQDQQK